MQIIHRQQSQKRLKQLDDDTIKEGDHIQDLPTTTNIQQIIIIKI